jgi:hypothetical protein
MAPTPTPTRQCAWPTNLDGDETIPLLVDGPVDQRCGLADPSYDAHYDLDADPLPVCDVHKPSAQTHGLHVTPAGEIPDHLNLRPLDDDRRARLTAPDLGHRLVDQEIVTTRTDDVELTTLANIAEAMNALPDNDTRRRVATWVADRYGAPL